MCGLAMCKFSLKGVTSLQTWEHQGETKCDNKHVDKLLFGNM
jgi:hypothetical protein